MDCCFHLCGSTLGDQVIIFNRRELDEIAKRVADEKTGPTWDWHIADNRDAGSLAAFPYSQNVVHCQAEVTPGSILPHRLLDQKMEFSVAAQSIPDQIQRSQRPRGIDFLQAEEVTVKRAGLRAAVRRPGDAHML